MSQWNERYSEPGFAYGDAPNDFLVECATRIQPRGRVLSLGEGEGRNAVFLAQQGFAVTGVDNAEVGLAKARALADERGSVIETVLADLATFEMGDGQWDAIVSIWCHLPPAIRARVHRESVRALAPGGLFILEAYTPAQLAFNSGGPRTIEMLYTADLLREELAGLEVQLARECEREVHEGRYHQGRSAVVQFVAKKP
ncbi:MAG: class I SAM-dependent methyltransferase [Polyangiales bacterium]